MGNYRLIYKRHFGIDFDKDFPVHHIDFDRSNNDISNLLLLPRELHAKYHLILNSIGANSGIADLRLTNMQVTEFNWLMFEQLPQVIAECEKWLRVKRYRYDKHIMEITFKRSTELLGVRKWQ